MLVISPFSRGGHVNSDPFDHTSLLRFLEARFNVKAPNVTEWRRKTVGDLTSTLDVGSSDVTPWVPPSLVNQQTDLANWCPANQSPSSLLAPPPALKIKVPQPMPKQATRSSSSR
jgi:phospholipase C